MYSINIAASKACNVVIDIIVVDNSTIIEEIDIINYPNVHVSVSKLNNVGYLIGAQTVINTCTNILDYDYVVISNVDITMTEDFFLNLKSVLVIQ